MALPYTHKKKKIIVKESEVSSLPFLYEILGLQHICCFPRFPARWLVGRMCKRIQGARAKSEGSSKI